MRHDINENEMTISELLHVPGTFATVSVGEALNAVLPTGIDVQEAGQVSAASLVAADMTEEEIWKAQNPALAAMADAERQRTERELGRMAEHSPRQMTYCPHCGKKLEN